MNGNTREFLDAAGKLGWSYAGIDGRGHIRLHHQASGQSYSASLTPSEYRSRRNTLADLERLSGRKLPRPNAAHHRHKRQPITAMRRSEEEERQLRIIDGLIREADEIRDTFTEASLAGEWSANLKQLMVRHNVIRETLASRYYRVIESLC